ncbi:hypothetical protein [Actinoplanes sp. NPDC023714]|uniref:hypothetical protein n=1 Tax=Actinoplanes sp. NPDC023714 TaxID=3154322 RepID=UPI0033F1124F
MIFSTGEAGESVAKDSGRLVDRCTHLSAGQAAIIGGAFIKMGKVESLISAAGHLLDAAESADAAADLWGRAEDLLTEAEVSSGEIESVMEQAGQTDLEARVAFAEASAELEIIGMSPATEPLGLVAEADQTASEVKAEVKTLPPANTRVQQLVTRLQAARTHLADLRRRLPSE